MKDKTQFKHGSEPIAWHREALKEAEQARRSGHAGFVDWETAKQHLRDKKE